jgi:hypothetical protein
MNEEGETFTEELNMNFDFIRREFSEIDNTNKIFRAINKRMADKTGLNMEKMKFDHEEMLKSRKKNRESSKKSPSPSNIKKDLTKNFSLGVGMPNVERRTSDGLYGNFILY